MSRYYLKLATHLRNAKRSLISIKNFLEKLSFKTLLFIVFFLLIIIVGIIKFTSSPPKISASWWNDNWNYRVPISIGNTTGSTITDYQIGIGITTTTLVTEGKMQSDCDDIRVTDDSGNILPHWTETNGLNACNQNNTLVWVKIPSIPSPGTTTIFVYYGNPSASSSSDGDNVFTFFDDFNDATIDTNKWTVSGSMLSISNGRLRADRANGTGSLFSKTTFPRPFILDLDFYPTQYPSGWVGSYHNSIGFGTYNTSYLAEHTWVPYGGGGNSYCGLCDDGGCYHGQFVNPVIVGNNLYKISMQVKPNQAGPQGVMTYSNRRDDSTGSQANDTVYTAATTGDDPLYVGVKDSGNNVSDDLEWDNWRIRKFIAAPPTVNNGTEERYPDPIAYWKFDEGSGTTAHNSTSSKNNGTISGAVWKTEDQCVSGKCLYYDGTNDNINAGNDSSLNITDALTLETWVKFNYLDYTNNTGKLIGFGSKGSPDSPSPHSGWWFSYDNRNNNNSFGYTCFGNSLGGYQGGGNGFEGYNYTFSTGTWYHIAVTVTTTEARLYINGTQLGATKSISNLQLSDTGQNLMLGSLNGFAFHQGFLDEFKIFPYARNANQIKSDYTAGLTHSSTNQGVSASLGSNNKNSNSLNDGLVGYWKMDENTGSAILDSSGVGNSGAFGTGDSAPVWSTGKYGAGLSFDGSNDYLSLGNIGLSSLTNSTISFWRKATTIGNWLLFQGQTSGHYLLATNGANNFYHANVGSLTKTIYVDGVVATAPLTDTNWHHYVITGVDLSTWTTLSLSNYSGYQYTGFLDEIRIYNRPLSSSEVTQLYNYAPAPTAYWNFDESQGSIANDTSGNNHTGNLQNSPSWITGKFGKALDFNASGKKVLITNPIGQPGYTTVSLWYKVSGTASGSWRTILGHQSANIHPLIINNASRNIGIWDGNWKDFGFLPPTDNQFHHYEIIYENGINATLYVDGIYKNQIATTLDLSVNPIGLIGDWSGNTYWAGPIDDVKIYNYARTPKQIVEDMNASHPIGGSPVGSQTGYWKLDEGFGSTVNNSGNQKNILNGVFGVGDSSPSWSANGKINKALSFDGTNDYVQINNSTTFNNSSAFSVSTWINSNNISQEQTIVSANPPFFLRISGSKLRIGIYTNSAWTFVNGNKSLSSNIWYHIALVYDGLTMKSFINGVLDTTTAKTGILASFSTIYLGRPIPGGEQYPFSGLIDEVKIYNSALSDNEIKLDYNQGSAIVLGSTYTNASNSPDNSSAKEYCIPGDNSVCTPPIGEWKFDERTGNTANDTSGNNYSGTINGPTWTTGKIGSALNFNGSNNNISTSFPSTPLTSYTAEAWVNPTNLVGAGDHNTYGYTIMATSSNYGLWLTLRGSEARLWAFASSNANYQETVGANIVPNQWFHIAAVATQNGPAKIYVNGIEKKSFTASDNAAWTGTLTFGDLRPGRLINFDGKIDQVQIYNYARTPAQIAYDYNRGAPVAWWKMDECQGSQIHDASGNNLIGNLSIGTSGTQTAAGTCESNNMAEAWFNGKSGRFNSSIKLDGTDDYIQVSHSSLLSPASITASGWIKFNSNSPWMIIDKGSSADFGAYYIYGDNLNWGEWSIFGPTGTRYDCVLGTFTTGNWYHLAGTFDATTGQMKCYVNGVLKSTVNGAALGSNTMDVYLGRYTYGYQTNGWIDDIRVYNYSLTDIQIKALYNDGAVRFGP